MEDRSTTGRGPRALGVWDRQAVAIASLALGAVLAVSMYVMAFGSGTVRSLGSDSAGYVVQMRGASAGVFDLQGSRPGVAVTGAFLVGTGLTAAGAAPIVMSVTLAACLGLAAAVAVRRTFGLSPWAMGVVVLVVATWGGTARLASGYLANLLSLTFFLLAMILALARGPGRVSLAVVALSLACFLAHPGLAPVYLVIVIGWCVACTFSPRLRERTRLRASEGVATSGAFLIALAIAVAVLAGVLGLEMRDIVDFTFVRERFDERAAHLVRWLSPGLTLTMVLAGVLIGLVRRSITMPAAATRLGIVWLVISAAGLLVLAVFPTVPGHRTILLGVPAPMLGGVLISSGAQMLIEKIRPVGRIRVMASTAVAVITLAVSLWIAVVALRPFDARARASVSPKTRAASTVASYLMAVDAKGPVVIVANPPSDGAKRWKKRQNFVRSLAPDDVFLSIAMYLGDERKLLRGVQTYRRGPGSELFNVASDRTWPAVRKMLDDDPIIVVVRSWVQRTVWKRVVALAPEEVPTIAVLQGPVPDGEVIPMEEIRLPLVEAAVRVVLLVLILGIIGGGWSAFILRGRGSPADMAALAPTFGLALVLIIAMGVALLGANPGDPVSLGAVGITGAIGWIRSVRFARGVRTDIRLSALLGRATIPPLLSPAAPGGLPMETVAPISARPKSVITSGAESALRR